MTETQQTMTEFTYATGETDVIGDRFSPSVVLFWLKTSVAASNMRVMYKSPNTLLGVIPLGSSTQTIPLRNIASVDTNTKFNLGSFVWGAVFLVAGLSFLSSSALVGILFFLLAPARHRLQQGIPIREHVRGSRLESTWIRLQLSFVTISLMRVSILMRSMTKDACAHYRAGSVPPRTGTCWRLTMANS